MELYPAGPTPVEITEWIKATYPDTVIASAMGATFFSLDVSHWPNFATIVTTDEHDLGEPSKLSRPGVFRLNIATSKETFERIVGRMENPDYAALDRILPHPVYAKQRWVCVLNPSHRTFEEQVKPLWLTATSVWRALASGGSRRALTPTRENDDRGAGRPG